MKIKFTLSVLSICFFILKASAQLTVSVTVTPNNPCDTCINLSGVVSGGTNPYTYQWYLNNSTIGTGQNIIYCRHYVWTGSSDSIMLLVTDAASQQISWFSTGANLIPSNIPIGYQLCIVTTDTATGKNLLVWNQTTNSSVVSYNIWKQNTSSVWTTIANVPRSSFSTFVDTASNPAQQSYWYHISVLDSCGLESSLTANGAPLNTTHLVISAGIPPAWNLTWNFTQMSGIVKYRIWRGTTTSSPVVIDSVASSVFSYTDLTPPANVSKYLIEGVSTNNCNPSLKYQNTFSAYSSSFSNIATILNASVNEVENSLSLSISPNPFSSQTTLQSDNLFHNATLTVYNSFGQQVKQLKNISGQTVILSRNNLPSGLYFIALSLNPSPNGGGTQGGGGEVIATAKLVITDN